MFKIFERLRWVYLSVFSVQAIPMSLIIIWRESETGRHSSSFDLLIASVLKIDDVCYLSIITSVIFVDIGRYLVGILIKAPQDRAYEEGLSRGMREGMREGKEQGIVMGAAEERQRWIEYDRRLRDWYRRYKASQDKGEPFDEPPPDAP